MILLKNMLIPWSLIIGNDYLTKKCDCGRGPGCIHRCKIAWLHSSSDGSPKTADSAVIIKPASEREQPMIQFSRERNY
jgi:hypothetical protein